MSKVIGFIPCRSGSKRIVDKNLTLFNSKFLRPYIVLLTVNLAVVAIGSAFHQTNNQLKLYHVAKYLSVHTEDVVVFENGNYIMTDVWGGEYTRDIGAGASCASVNSVLPFSPLPLC